MHSLWQKVPKSGLWGESPRLFISTLKREILKRKMEPLKNYKPLEKIAIVILFKLLTKILFGD